MDVRRRVVPTTSRGSTLSPSGRLTAKSRQASRTLPAVCSAACRCSAETTRIRVVRRPDATVAVCLARCDPFVLPTVLGELSLLLAAEGGHRAEGEETPVGFKSAQLLVDALATRLDRMVTRRDLARWVAALRRVFDAHVACGGRLVESRRGFGWRINLAYLDLPRRPAASAGGCVCPLGDR
jgi:hypothetical protein